MPVDSTRLEVSQREERWDLVDDLVNFDVKCGERREVYLPKPNPTDTTPENLERYNQYVKRSVLYNFVKRTLEGLRGTVMEREPMVSLPSDMEYVLDDMDGNGLSLFQQTREILGGVLTKGRYGILASFPDTTRHREAGQGFLTAAQMRELSIRAYATTYHPKDIINWDTDLVGAVRLTTLVVLREQYNDAEDEFAHSPQSQYRVLRLGPVTEKLAEMAGIEVTDDLVYYQQVYREGEVAETIVPRRADGSLFERIPFEFVGSEDNSPNVDDIPLYDLAEINVGHFRNSADFEESSFLVGQPQVTGTGLTEHWIENVWQGKMYFGSRAVLTGPQGSTFQLLQASPNSMPMEGMKHKEEVMIKLGAQLVTADTVQKTATEAAIQNRSDKSVLSSVAANVSDAMTKTLKVMAEYNGAASDDIEYTLNQDYGAREATPEQINSWLAALAQGAMSLRTYLSNMKKGGQLPEGVTVEDEERRLQNRRNGVPENGDVDTLRE